MSSDKNAMSSSDKTEIIVREERSKSLDDNDVERSSMNELIMNYLVIGKIK